MGGKHPRIDQQKRQEVVDRILTPEVKVLIGKEILANTHLTHEQGNGKVTVYVARKQLYYAAAAVLNKLIAADQLVKDKCMWPLFPLWTPAEWSEKQGDEPGSKVFAGKQCDYFSFRDLDATPTPDGLKATPDAIAERFFLQVRRYIHNETAANGRLI
jgi:hypothetical protein